MFIFGRWDHTFVRGKPKEMFPHKTLKFTKYKTWYKIKNVLKQSHRCISDFFKRKLLPKQTRESPGSPLLPPLLLLFEIAVGEKIDSFIFQN